MLFVANTEVGEWVDMFRNCHNPGRALREWPNGRPYNEQPAVVVGMFELIRGVLVALDA